jgi:hypothetical protein
VSLWARTSGSQVEVDWGLSDARATVGRVLQYQIPPTAFKGENLSYKVGNGSGRGVVVLVLIGMGKMC